jgi:hypothetical protein
VETSAREEKTSLLPPFNSKQGLRLVVANDSKISIGQPNIPIFLAQLATEKLRL